MTDESGARFVLDFVLRYDAGFLGFDDARAAVAELSRPWIGVLVLVE